GCTLELHPDFTPSKWERTSPPSTGQPHHRKQIVSVISRETAISENVASPVAMRAFTFTFILAGAAGRIYPGQIHPGQVHPGQNHAGQIHAGRIHAGRIYSEEIHVH